MAFLYDFADPIYRRGTSSETVLVVKTVQTSLSIEARGEADGYAAPQTVFGDDENVRAQGILTAGDGANLAGRTVSVSLNGHHLADVTLGTGNTWSIDLGVLAEGSYVVDVVFQRLRLGLGLGSFTEEQVITEYEPSEASITIGADPIYKAAKGSQRFQVRRLQAPNELLTAALVGLGVGLAAGYTIKHYG